MTLVCPVCHSRNSVEAALLTEAGQAYTRLLLQQPDWLRFSLARYILLWAPPKSEMAYDRRLRLTTETLAIDPDPRRLAAALAETVEAIMAKRRDGDVRPLTKHNYLKRVLEGLPALAPAIETTAGSPVVGFDRRPALRRPSKLEQAEELLAEWAGTDALRQVIGAGLAALLAKPLAKAPEGAAIDRTASLWERDLRKHGLAAPDAARLEIAFDRLLSRVKDWFPVADALFEFLPPGAKRAALPEPPPDEEQVAKAKAFFGNLIGDKGLPKAEKIDEETRRRQLQEQARQLQQGGQ